MKKILTCGMLFLFSLSSPAFADWAEDFMATFARSGPEPAVVEALADGVAPADIIKMIQQTGGIEPVAVVKALYCAELSPTTVQAAGSEAGLPESVVVAGYRQSVGQCGPAAAFTADPFSRTGEIAGGGTPYSGQGEPPVIPPGPEGGGGTGGSGGSGGGGGGGIVVPPPASPFRFN